MTYKIKTILPVGYANERVITMNPTQNAPYPAQEVTKNFYIVYTDAGRTYRGTITSVNSTGLAGTGQTRNWSISI